MIVGGWIIAASVIAGPVEDLEPGHWFEVSNSVLADVEKKPDEYADFNGSSSASYDSYQRNSGVRAVVENWCGAAFDIHEDRLVVFGGGHNGYGGNELYAFDLDTLAWERLTDPTVDPLRCAEENPDGTPTSRHSYGGLAYIAAAGRMYQSGGAWDCAAGGGGLDAVWTFDFDGGSWQRMDPAGVEINDYFEQKTVYDPVTERVYHHAHGWFEYDYATNTLEEKPSFNNWSSLSMAIDPEARVVVEIGDGEALLFDLTADDRMGAQLTAQGSDAISGFGNPGLRYDNALGRIVAWTGGTSVYSLDLDNNTWETHAPADTNMVEPSDVTAAGGTYGRFAYSQTHNIYVLVNDAEANVYLYKLSPGSGTPPDPPDGSDDTGGSTGSDDGADTDGGTDDGDDDGEADDGASDADPDDGGSDSAGSASEGSGSGQAGDDGGDSGGCSCRTTNTGFGLGGLALLLLIRRRQPIA